MTYEDVIAALEEDPAVSIGTRKGFGSGALTVGGKIFAMRDWRNRYVVKLPAPRVRDLLASGAGAPFETGQGRVMKQWVVVLQGDWIALAREARDFVAVP